MEKITNFIDKKPLKSDSQNVHDTVVNSSLRQIYSDIKDTVVICNIDHIAEELKHNEKASKTIKTIKESNTGMATIGSNEIDILEKVWNRQYKGEISLPDIRESIIRQLEDCIEDGNVVCATGRMGRILNSLTLIDPEIGIIETLDTKKYAELDRYKTLLDRKIMEYKNSTNEEERKYAESFTNPSIQYDPTVETRFKTELLNVFVKDIDPVFTDKKRELLLNEISYII